MGCVYAYVIILTLLGPERKGRSMEAIADEDLAEATGTDVKKLGYESEHRESSRELA